MSGESFLDETVRVLDFLLAQQCFGQGDGQRGIIRRLPQRLLVKRNGLLEIAVKKRDIGGSSRRRRSDWTGDGG